MILFVSYNKFTYAMPEVHIFKMFVLLKIFLYCKIQTCTDYFKRQKLMRHESLGALIFPCVLKCQNIHHIVSFYPIGC